MAQTEAFKLKSKVMVLTELPTKWMHQHNCCSKYLTFKLIAVHCKYIQSAGQVGMIRMSCVIIVGPVIYRCLQDGSGIDM